MTDITKSPRRPAVVLHLPKAVPALIAYALNIVRRMTENPAFPNPSPTLATITTAINDLQSSQAAAIARTKGAAAMRNEKRAALVALLELLRAYIQTTADANPANGTSIVESAGVAVRKLASRQPRTFGAKAGAVSGVAKVIAKAAARRASYDWEYSTDGGKTWVTAPSTLQAKTSVTGLTPGSTVQFKYRAVTKTGEGDWSQPVSLMVH